MSSNDLRGTVTQNAVHVTLSPPQFIVPPCRDISLEFYGSSPTGAVEPDRVSNAQNGGTGFQGSLHFPEPVSITELESQFIDFGLPTLPPAPARQCGVGHGCILQPPAEIQPAIRTDIAFGDGQGTVGYINEFGELMNMRCVLDVGLSGLLRVGPNSSSFHSADAEHIIQGSCPGIGLRLHDRSVPEKEFHPVSYIHDRWPKVSYSTGCVEIEIQFAAVDKKIVQQCFLHNKGDIETTIDLVFDLGFALESPQDSRVPLRDPIEFNGGISTSGNTCIVLGGGPGGYASFRASLFVDHGRPVVLRPNTIKHLTQSSDEIKNEIPVNEEEEKENTVILFHTLPLKVLPGRQRELTAVYLFDYKPWSRDQIYDMKIMTEESEDFYLSQRVKENSFLKAYREAKDKGDNEQAKRILEGVVPTELVAPVSKATSGGTSNSVEFAREFFPGDQQRAEQESHARDKSQVPFQNLGGESLFSHRLFGHEWKSSSTYVDTMEWAAYYDLMYSDKATKHREEMRKLVESKFKALRAGFQTAPDVFVDVGAYLSINCPGRWIKGLPDLRTDFLFRRHLQNLLSVVPIAVPWTKEGHCAYFLSAGGLHKVLTEPATTLYQFRFLVYMHRLLTGGDVIIDDALKRSIQSDIETVCKGHLEWCFEIAQKTKSGLWTSTYAPPGAKITNEDDHLHGATNFLKLFDFYMEFPTSQRFVLLTLQRDVFPWLEALRETRNKNSSLWESVRETVEVSWWDPSYRTDEVVSVPNYDLCDSVQYWQTLQTFFNIMEEMKTRNAKTPIKSSNLASLRLLRTSATTVDQSAHSTDLSAESVPNMENEATAHQNCVQELQDVEQGLLMYLERSDLKKELDPAVFREKILERFSSEKTMKLEVENHASFSEPLKAESNPAKRRTLTIKQCGKERPRWNWYAETMVLCPKFDLGFFESDHHLERLPEWSYAVDAQRFQIEKFWKKPFRYTLALILASDSKISLDKSKDPASMATTCRNILLGSVLSNGLMAEEIDPKNKKPNYRFRYSMRTVYGVPYYLLRTTCENSLGSLTRTIPTVLQDTKDNTTFDDKIWKKDYKAIRSRTKAGLYNIASVDMAKVVDLSEECQPEWLFDDPWYFTAADLLSDKAGNDEDDEDYHTPKYIKDKVESELKSLKDLVAGEDNFPYAIFEDAIRLHSYSKDTFVDSTQGERIASVVDVIRTGKRQSAIQELLFDPWELLEHLFKKRTKNDVKKRSVYIYNCGPRFSISLFLSVPEKERFSMAAFLSRHQNRDVFHRDDTHRTINSWVTELHLGFYRIISPTAAHDSDDDSNDSDDSDGDRDSRWTTIFSRKRSRLPGLKTKIIDKGAIGFRFDGDLYDRYWTCHVAVYLPECGDRDRWFGDVESFRLIRPTGEGNKDTQHSQRKVLEARWFERATRIISDETRNILSSVSGALGENDNGIYTASSYDTFRETFQTNKTTYFQYGEMVRFLRHVVENLEAVQNAIGEWETRETSREVQPRWTRDDEAAYANEIFIWRRRAKANTENLAYLKGQIHAKLEHIKQLREWLLDDLQLKEARVSNRSADDVRIFTYATVIFLPLSFASSIFSMGGAPSHSTAVSFVSAAIIALVATVAFVLNAGTLMRTITRWKIWVFDLEDEGGFLEHSESQWHGFGRKFYDWFVRFPSERVLIASRVATMQDHKGIFGKLLLGVLLLPLFAFAWVLTFLAVNVYDSVKLLFLDLPQYPKKRQKHLNQLKAAESAAQPTDFQKADRAKDKDGKSSGQVLNPKEKQKRAAKKAGVKWRQERLKRFMRKPRVQDISKHLDEGKTFHEILEAHREDIEHSKTELEDRRRRYRSAISEVSDPDETDTDDGASAKSRRPSRRLARMFRRKWREADEETAKHDT